MLHFGNYDFKIILSVLISCDKRNKQSQLVADGIGNIFNPCLCILYYHVACWYNENGTYKVEVYYVGSRESAPY